MLLLLAVPLCRVFAQEKGGALQEELSNGLPLALPKPADGDRALPINLPTALQLTHARAIDIAIASERIRIAAAQLDRARVLWLPTIQLGIDYFRHDGRIQNVEGNLFDTDKSSFMVGAAPIAVFAVSDAIYEPLAARQVVRARAADLQAATNDSVLAVAEAYFNAEQARGELAGAEDAVRRGMDLLQRTEKLASPGVGIIPTLEVTRVRTELAHRKQTARSAYERWRLASADLVRILRMDAGAIVEPLEPPDLRITLIGPELSLDQLIPIALMNRPELASQRALVQAGLERLREERVRPLLPSVLLRGASTNPAGTLAAGVFGGGRNERIADFGARSDFDIEVLWELQNLGLGNRARVQERRAQTQESQLQFFRLEDRVASEVSQAYAQLQSASARITEAETEVKDGLDSLQKNLEGLTQPKGAPLKTVTLIVRPQEVVAALQALALAYNDYYGAVGDFNRAQFRLYHALGQPAQALTADFGHGTLATDCPPPATTVSQPAAFLPAPRPVP
jgi:outer membrane protein TolC